MGFQQSGGMEEIEKEHAPSLPFRMMQVALQVSSLETAGRVKDILSILDGGETRVLMLERAFHENISSRMKAEILIPMLPVELRYAIVQHADRLVDHKPAKEQMIAIV